MDGDVKFTEPIIESSCSFIDEMMMSTECNSILQDNDALRRIKFRIINTNLLLGKLSSTAKELGRVKADLCQAQVSVKNVDLLRQKLFQQDMQLKNKDEIITELTFKLTDYEQKKLDCEANVAHIKQLVALLEQKDKQLSTDRVARAARREAGEPEPPPLMSLEAASKKFSQKRMVRTLIHMAEMLDEHNLLTTHYENKLRMWKKTMKFEDDDEEAKILYEISKQNQQKSHSVERKSCGTEGSGDEELENIFREMSVPALLSPIPSPPASPVKKKPPRNIDTQTDIKGCNLILTATKKKNTKSSGVQVNIPIIGINKSVQTAPKSVITCENQTKEKCIIEPTVYSIFDPVNENLNQSTSSNSINSHKSRTAVKKPDFPEDKDTAREESSVRKTRSKFMTNVDSPDLNVIPPESKDPVLGESPTRKSRHKSMSAADKPAHLSLLSSESMNDTVLEESPTRKSRRKSMSAADKPTLNLLPSQSNDRVLGESPTRKSRRKSMSAADKPALSLPSSESKSKQSLGPDKNKNMPTNLKKGPLQDFVFITPETKGKLGVQSTSKRNEKITKSDVPVKLAPISKSSQVTDNDYDSDDGNMSWTSLSTAPITLRNKTLLSRKSVLSDTVASSDQMYQNMMSSQQPMMQNYFYPPSPYMAPALLYPQNFNPYIYNPYQTYNPYQDQYNPYFNVGIPTVTYPIEPVVPKLEYDDDNNESLPPSVSEANSYESQKSANTLNLSATSTILVEPHSVDKMNNESSQLISAEASVTAPAVTLSDKSDSDNQSDEEGENESDLDEDKESIPDDKKSQQDSESEQEPEKSGSLVSSESSDSENSVESDSEDSRPSSPVKSQEKEEKQEDMLPEFQVKSEPISDEEKQTSTKLSVLEDVALQLFISDDSDDEFNKNIIVNPEIKNENPTFKSTHDEREEEDSTEKNQQEESRKTLPKSVFKNEQLNKNKTPCETSSKDKESKAQKTEKSKALEELRKKLFVKRRVSNAEKKRLEMEPTLTATRPSTNLQSALAETDVEKSVTPSRKRNRVSSPIEPEEKTEVRHVTFKNTDEMIPNKKNHRRSLSMNDSTFRQTKFRRITIQSSSDEEDSSNLRRVLSVPTVNNLCDTPADKNIQQKLKKTPRKSETDKLQIDFLNMPPAIQSSSDEEDFSNLRRVLSVPTVNNLCDTPADKNIQQKLKKTPRKSETDKLQIDFLNMPPAIQSSSDEEDSSNLRRVLSVPTVNNLCDTPADKNTQQKLKKTPRKSETDKLQMDFLNMSDIVDEGPRKLRSRKSLAEATKKKPAKETNVVTTKKNPENKKTAANIRKKTPEKIEKRTVKEKLPESTVYPEIENVVKNIKVKRDLDTENSSEPTVLDSPLFAANHSRKTQEKVVKRTVKEKQAELPVLSTEIENVVRNIKTERDLDTDDNSSKPKIVYSPVLIDLTSDDELVLEKPKSALPTKKNPPRKSISKSGIPCLKKPQKKEESKAADSTEHKDTINSRKELRVNLGTPVISPVIVGKEVMESPPVIKIDPDRPASPIVSKIRAPITRLIPRVLPSDRVKTQSLVPAICPSKSGEIVEEGSRPPKVRLGDRQAPCKPKVTLKTKTVDIKKNCEINEEVKKLDAQEKLSEGNKQSLDENKQISENKEKPKVEIKNKAKKISRLEATRNKIAKNHRIYQGTIALAKQKCALNKSSDKNNDKDITESEVKGMKCRGSSEDRESWSSSPTQMEIGLPALLSPLEDDNNLESPPRKIPRSVEKPEVKAAKQALFTEAKPLPAVLPRKKITKKPSSKSTINEISPLKVKFRNTFHSPQPSELPCLFDVEPEILDLELIEQPKSGLPCLFDAEPEILDLELIEQPKSGLPCLYDAEPEILGLELIEQPKSGLPCLFDAEPEILDLELIEQPKSGLPCLYDAVPEKSALELIEQPKSGTDNRIEEKSNCIKKERKIKIAPGKSRIQPPTNYKMDTEIPVEKHKSPVKHSSTLDSFKSLSPSPVKSEVDVTDAKKMQVESEPIKPEKDVKLPVQEMLAESLNQIPKDSVASTLLNLRPEAVNKPDIPKKRNLKKQIRRLFLGPLQLLKKDEFSAKQLEELMNQLLVLSPGTPHAVIAEALVLAVTGDKTQQEAGEKSRTDLRVLLVVSQLDASQQYKGMTDTLLDIIPSIVMKPRAGTPSELANVCAAARLLVLLCKVRHDIHPARKLLYDTLCNHRYMASAVAYEIITIWPAVIPSLKDGKFSKEQDLPLLVQCMILVMLSFEPCEDPEGLYRVRELRAVLKDRHGMIPGCTAEELLEHSVMLLQGGNSEGFETGVYLLACCQGVHWTKQHLVVGTLTPLLSLHAVSPHADQAAQVAARLLGMITQRVPFKDNKYVANMMGALSGILQASGISEALRESIGHSLLFMARSTQSAQLVASLGSWVPKQPLSKELLDHMSTWVTKTLGPKPYLQQERESSPES